MLNSDRFRGDVEALRGIAVILVFLFHLKLQFIPSGFIGVDIFFVISGYLMAVAFNGPERSIGGFYERRARRVLPAALVIMALCYVMGPLFFLPFESAKLKEQVIGIFLFVPNLVFWKMDDYFSALNFAPMLHYWSLGIELQYYLVFPILVYLFKNRLKWFFLLLVLSLMLCIFITPLMSKTAFFMLPTRLWEFFLGFFAFHIGQTLLAKNVLSNRARNSLVGVAAALLIAYALFPIPKEQFPGVYAIPAAVLSFLIIAVGVNNTYVEGNFFFGGLRWFGRLSYSIYLIHYPVIFVFIYHPFSEWKILDTIDCVAIVAITLMLAMLSYQYIEIPFRDRKKFSLKKFLLSILGVYIFMIGAIIVYERFSYFSGSYPARESRVFEAMNDTGNFRCSKWQKIKEYRESSCYLSRGSGRSFYLVGDSHMDALKEAFVEVSNNYNATVRLNKSRCFLGESQCSYEQIAEQVKRFNITDVVMHGWAYEKFNYSNLQKLVDASESLGIRVHIIGPVPTYSKSVPLDLFKDSRGDAPLIELMPTEKFLAGISLQYREFRSNNLNKHDVYFYTPEKYLCSETCRLEGEKGIYYYDEHHLTITGASVLAPLFDEIMKNSD